MHGWIKRWEIEREKLDDPRRIAMIDAMIEHLRLEADGNWDAVMVTIDDDAVFRATGFGITGVRIADKKQQRQLYEDEDRAVPGYLAGLEVRHERFIVGPDTVAFDGRAFRVFTGEQLPTRGLEVPAHASGRDEFLVSWRMASFVEIRDGCVAGKNTYVGTPRIDDHRPSPSA
jgi:hypothetical protein